MIQVTICYLVRDKQVCLGLKKRGFGVNRWNGFGGKAKEGESAEEAAERELTEEASVVSKSLEKVAEIIFIWPQIDKEKDWDHTAHVYICKSWSGKPREGEEMRPAWFDFDKVPYDQSWPDDKIWLPVVLSGKRLKAEFSFGKNEKILDQKINLVEGFS